MYSSLILCFALVHAARKFALLVDEFFRVFLRGSVCSLRIARFVHDHLREGDPDPVLVEQQLQLAVQIAVGVTMVANMGMKADQENVKRRVNGVPALYTMFMQGNKDKKDPGKEGHE